MCRQLCDRRVVRRAVISDVRVFVYEPEDGESDETRRALRPGGPNRPPPATTVMTQGRSSALCPCDTEGPGRPSVREPQGRADVLGWPATHIAACRTEERSTTTRSGWTPRQAVTASTTRAPRQTPVGRRGLVMLVAGPRAGRLGEQRFEQARRVEPPFVIDRDHGIASGKPKWGRQAARAGDTLLRCRIGQEQPDWASHGWWRTAEATWRRPCIT